MARHHKQVDTEKYRSILSAVHMVYRLVNSTYNVKELSLRLTRLMCQFIKADSASVLILDPVRKKIVLVAIFDNKINILWNRRKDLANVSQKEILAAEGTAIFEERLIGLPLVADENLGAIFVRRSKRQPSFSEFDREMLTAFAEQSVTAIRNIQLYEGQQNIILESMKFIGSLLKRQSHSVSTHTPVFFKIMKSLAEKLNVSPQGIESLYYASVLHDAGAIDVPYEILSKTSQLTAEEFKIIHDHPAKSVEFIRPVAFLKPVLPIILYHHEKYDGSGYPSGLRKEQIPFGARIMSVVDAFEAMTRGRPYRRTMSIDEALHELSRNSGTQFDPRVVEAFCDLSCQKKFRNYLRSINR